MSFPETTVYRFDGVVLVLCGVHGAEGIYRLFLGSGRPWGFCPPGSQAWDSYHQHVFLTGRVEAVEPTKLTEFAGVIPTLPTEWPPPPELEVKDVERVATPPAATVGGRLHSAVKAADSQRLEVYVVLSEDTYESTVGDGIYRYFAAAFRAKRDAKQYMKDARQDGYAYYLRRVHLVLSGDSLALDTTATKGSPFDHMQVGEVCAYLDEHDASASSP